MHLLEDHTTPWARCARVGFGFGLLGEQGAESIHASSQGPYVGIDSYAIRTFNFNCGEKMWQLFYTIRCKYLLSRLVSRFQFGHRICPTGRKSASKWRCPSKVSRFSRAVPYKGATTKPCDLGHK